MSPARVRAGHCDTGSAFVPPIASLIAAATADRSVLAIGHDFEVIPVMAFLFQRLPHCSGHCHSKKCRAIFMFGWPQASKIKFPFSSVLETNSHCNLPHDCAKGYCLPRRSLIVKSPFHALPLDVVSGVAGRAAPEPIFKCFAMNARFGSCVVKYGHFRKAVEDNSHAVRR